jgi:hypothetical protein
MKYWQFFSVASWVGLLQTLQQRREVGILLMIDGLPKENQGGGYK